jgi:hypothetical protein
MRAQKKASQKEHAQRVKTFYLFDAVIFRLVLAISVLSTVLFFVASITEL